MTFKAAFPWEHFQSWSEASQVMDVITLMRSKNINPKPLTWLSSTKHFSVSLHPQKFRDYLPHPKTPIVTIKVTLLHSTWSASVLQQVHVQCKVCLQSPLGCRPGCPRILLAAAVAVLTFSGLPWRAECICDCALLLLPFSICSGLRSP